jgi:hypothetical protein
LIGRGLRKGMSPGAHWRVEPLKGGYPECTNPLSGLRSAMAAGVSCYSWVSAIAMQGCLVDGAGLNVRRFIVVAGRRAVLCVA